MWPTTGSGDRTESLSARSWIGGAMRGKMGSFERPRRARIEGAKKRASSSAAARPERQKAKLNRQSTDMYGGQ
jgi:hypothetical protein